MNESCCSSCVPWCLEVLMATSVTQWLQPQHIFICRLLKISFIPTQFVLHFQLWLRTSSHLAQVGPLLQILISHSRLLITTFFRVNRCNFWLQSDYSVFFQVTSSSLLPCLSRGIYRTWQTGNACVSKHCPNNVVLSIQPEFCTIPSNSISYVYYM